MPLLNNYTANSPSFMGGVGQGTTSTGTEPQSPSFSSMPPMGGGSPFSSGQRLGGLGGLFGGYGAQATPTPQPTPMPAQQPQQPMLPHAPTTGISPIFSQPRYQPPMNLSAAVQNAIPQIMKFANPATSPNTQGPFPL